VNRGRPEETAVATQQQQSGNGQTQLVKRYGVEQHSRHCVEREAKWILVSCQHAWRKGQDCSNNCVGAHTRVYLLLG
jgi:hypothetical protein